MTVTHNLPKTLLVSAWWPECKELAQWFGDATVQPLETGEWFISSQSAVAVLCTGIGAISAAIFVSRFLSEYKSIGQVIFCGTAGHYKSDISLGDVCFSAESFYSDAGIVLHSSYFPPKQCNFQKIECPYFQIQKPALYKDIFIAKCLTVPSITTKSQLAEEFSKIADIEHLEFHGVAMAAKAFDRPWAGFFGISNFVGDQAHAQWKTFQSAASLAAQKALYASMVF